MIPGPGAATTWRVCSGIPSDPAAAVRIAVEAPERLLDVASVGDSPFLGIASFGFDSDANRIANEAKWVRGNAVYLYAALRALAAWKPARSRSGSTASATPTPASRSRWSGSKAYGGGMFVLPQAELDDGKLDVLVSKQLQADLPA